MKPSILVSILFTAIATVSASSPPPKPFKRITHPRTLSLEILPRQPSSPNPNYFINHRSKRSPSNKRSSTPSTSNGPLRHSDSFRLTLEAFDDLFHLHLSPNKDLFHEAARINYYAPDGTITRSEPLRAEDYRVYHGVVMHPDFSHQRLREDIAGGVASGGLQEGELGWARIMVHDHGNIPKGLPPLFEGAFSANGVIYHVQSKEKYERNKHKLDPAIEAIDLDSRLVMFRDSDIDVDYNDPSSKPHSCSHDTSSFNTEKMKAPRDPFSYGLDSGDAWWHKPRGGIRPVDVTDLDAGLSKRDDISGNVTSNYIDRIGSTQGCSTTQTIVYMGVAADCEYVSHHGGTANATSAILNNWNTASSLYKKTFNVSLGIVELAVQDATCPSTPPSSAPWNVACATSTDLNTRLSLFSQWRGDKGSSDGAGLWHLMSGCPTGTEVGVAWLQQLCVTTATSSNGEVVSGTGVSTAASTEWQVIAHEIGHNFGAIHDCASGCSLTDSCCPLSKTTCDANSAFIMSAVSQSTENSFSQCSIGNICAAMSTMDTSCVQPLDGSKKTLSLQMCGNGIVEDGEDCDPGVGATSNCCDASTCKFINNAKCDPQSSDCCTDQCTFAPSTQVCRPVRDAACDTQELCSGTSSTCPKDQTMKNGVSCGSNGLACANGACTSKDLQCQTQGVSLNLTKACPQNNDRSCRVSCLDPTNSGQCIILQAALIDGSPCGYGGTCQNSTCVSGSAFDTFKAWYRSNLQIAIPVTIVVGIIVLLILWSLFKAIVRCCTTRKSGAKRIPSVVSAHGRQRLGSWSTPGPGTAYPPPGFNDQYALREAPATSTRGYTTPGTDYPPFHTEDPNNVVGRDQSRWVDDAAYNGRR